MANKLMFKLARFPESEDSDIDIGPGSGSGAGAGQGLGGSNQKSRLSYVVIKQHGATLLHMVNLDISQPRVSGSVLHDRWWTAPSQKKSSSLLSCFTAHKSRKQPKQKKQVISVGTAHSQMTYVNTLAHLTRGIAIPVHVQDEKHSGRLTRAFHKPNKKADWPTYIPTDWSDVATELVGDGLPVVIIGWSM